MRASLLPACIPVNREAALRFFLHFLDLLLGLVSLFLYVGLYLLFGFVDLLLCVSGGLVGLLLGISSRVSRFCFYLLGFGF